MTCNFFVIPSENDKPLYKIKRYEREARAEIFPQVYEPEDRIFRTLSYFVYVFKIVVNIF